VKVDKTLVASAALHVVVLGWGLVSFSSRAFETIPEESLPVEIISADQLAHVTAGVKTGSKDVKKPMAEKVAEAKPVDDVVGKITEKPPVITETAPPPQPKPEEKPVEKKPDPPKPVVENKPKEEPKPIEKKPDPPKVDPIAEALKKEEKKPPPKPPVQAAAKPPEQAKPKTERVFDQSKIAALLDKRDPNRQAVTGDTLNSNAALGLSKGKAADNSATWGSLFKSQVDRCWKVPYGGIESQNPLAVFYIRLKRDGTLDGMPVPETAPTTPYLRVYQESALRAIIECQPYRLPAAFFEEWKYFAPEFSPERRT
jgi:outer membrane biosynthesis protein TonB